MYIEVSYFYSVYRGFFILTVYIEVAYLFMLQVSLFFVNSNIQLPSGIPTPSNIMVTCFFLHTTQTAHSISCWMYYKKEQTDLDKCEALFLTGL